MAQTESKKPLRISFCTTCHGRLAHLKETLPKNLAAVQDYPNAEFVILDYGDKDGLGDWIRETFPEEIRSGRIRYARYESEYFRTSHAKNMAHRLGTGEVLCNLDADNFLAPGFAEWLNGEFSKKTNIYAHLDDTDPLSSGTSSRVNRGTYGRLAMGREVFIKLGGYSESFGGTWGQELTEALSSLDKAGIKHSVIPQEMYGNAIDHSNEVRVAGADPNTAQLSNEMLYIPRPRPELYQRNRDGRFGCGEVTVLKPDFTEEALTLGPVRDAGRSGGGMER